MFGRGRNPKVYPTNMARRILKGTVLAHTVRLKYWKPLFGLTNEGTLPTLKEKGCH